jgi:hypothetical protein
MANIPRSQEKSPAGAARQAAQATREQAERIAQTTADVNRQAAQVADKAAQTTREATRKGAEQAERIAQTAADVSSQAAQVVEQAAQATREATRKGAEQVERVAQATAGVNSQAAQVGAEIVQRNTQTLQRAMQSGTDMAAKLTERSLEQWTRAAERSSKNVGAILQSSLAIADTTQSITREWLDFARERIQHNFDRMDRLFRCRTPQDFVAVQSDVLKDNLEEQLGWTRHIAERSIPIAEEAMKTFSESMGRTANVPGEQRPTLG